MGGEPKYSLSDQSCLELMEHSIHRLDMDRKHPDLYWYLCFFCSMLFLGGNLKEVYRFADEFEVELASRCCRNWTDYEDQLLNEDSVAMAESIIKVCNTPYGIASEIVGSSSGRTHLKDVTCNALV